MVMKAVQQLLFDVDWFTAAEVKGNEVSQIIGEPEETTGVDVLVVDLPPGTGDVALSFGQLVQIDGSVIVSTPQDIALLDVRKGVAMFKKINVPILGAVLNMSHFTCSTCSTPHYIFGSTAGFYAAATKLGIPVLSEVPMESMLSSRSDSGIPILAQEESHHSPSTEALLEISRKVAKDLLL